MLKLTIKALLHKQIDFQDLYHSDIEMNSYLESPNIPLASAPDEAILQQNKALELLKSSTEKYFYQLPMQIQIDTWDAMANDYLFNKILAKITIGEGHRIAISQMPRESNSQKKSAARQMLLTNNALTVSELISLLKL